METSTPQPKRINNVMLHFLTMDEIQPGLGDKENSLQEERRTLELELKDSEEFAALKKVHNASIREQRNAEKALEAYEKKKEEERIGNRKATTADLETFSTILINGEAIVHPEMILPEGYYQSEVTGDDVLFLHKNLNHEAHQHRAKSSSAVYGFPANAKLSKVKSKLDSFYKALPQLARDAIRGCNEIHGITRERISKIVNLLDTEGSVDEAYITEEPSLYDAIRTYLASWGITDRLSYENYMFTFGNGSNSNYNGAKYILGAFPQNLVEITLGKKFTNVSESIYLEAGDKLFGELDIDSLTAKFKDLLSSKGIDSREKVLALKKDDLTKILEESDFTNRTILSRVIAGDRPGHFENSMNEIIAYSLFPEANPDPPTIPEGYTLEPGGSNDLLEYANADISNSLARAAFLNNLRKYAIGLIKAGSDMTAYMLKTWGGDEEVMRAAVKINSVYLKLGSEEIRANESFVLDVIREDASAINYASEKLRTNKRFLAEAVEANPEVTQYLQTALTTKS